MGQNMCTVTVNGNGTGLFVVSLIVSTQWYYPTVDSGPSVHPLLAATNFPVPFKNQKPVKQL